MFSKFFIERPIFAGVVAIVTVLLGLVALLAPADRAVPEHHAAHDLRHHQLPGCERHHGREHGGHPDRAAGQRRAGHALHAVLQRVGRHLHADRDLPGRHRHGYGADPGLPARRDRAGPAAAPGLGAGRHGQAAVDQHPAVRQPDLADRRLRQPVPDQLRARINLQNELARVPGVAQVKVLGAGTYSMRIWLDPQKMQSFGLVPDDVVQALNQQNVQVAAGQVGIPPQPPDQAFQFTINVLGRLDQVSQFEDIVVKSATDRRRPAGPRPRRGPGRAGCADLQQLLPPDRPAHRGHRDLPAADRQRARRWRRRSRRRWSELKRSFPAGPRLHDPVRHHDLRRATPSTA